MKTYLRLFFGEIDRKKMTLQKKEFLDEFKASNNCLPWFDTSPPPIGSKIYFHEQLEGGGTTSHISLKVLFIEYEYSTKECSVLIGPDFEDEDFDGSYFADELNGLLKKHWFSYTEIRQWVDEDKPMSWKY